MNVFFFFPAVGKFNSLVDFFVCKYADPYLNTDAGTMSPCEHGEVFVLDDGGEVIKLYGNNTVCILPSRHSSSSSSFQLKVLECLGAVILKGL